MRFDKLEFDRPADKPVGAELDFKVDKDEKYWARLADENRRTGSYETALRFYSRASEVNKTLVPAWVGQIQMLVQLHEYPQAALWSQKALELFPANGELLAGQAQAECRMGNMKQALALSDAALRQRGESAYRWQVRGELLVAGKDNTHRYCFDKAQLAETDWLVPLESALIYCYLQSLQFGSAAGAAGCRKGVARLLRLVRARHVPGQARFRYIRTWQSSTLLGDVSAACRRHEGTLRTRPIPMVVAKYVRPIDRTLTGAVDGLDPRTNS